MKKFLLLFFIPIICACDCVITCKNTNTGVVIGNGFGPCFCSSYGAEWVAASNEELQEYEKKINEETNIQTPVAKSDKKYVFVEYSWGHRPGTGQAGFRASLTAFEGWIMLPNDANGGIYNLKHSYAEQFSREDCEEQLAESLKDEKFENPDDCSDKSSTCFTIKNNTVIGTGYLDTGSFFHCVPYDFWQRIKPRAEDKCYAPDDVYGLDDEVPCPDYILKMDKDIHKSPSSYHGIIKKCSDYKEDSLFVCETDQIP